MTDHGSHAHAHDGTHGHGGHGGHGHGEVEGPDVPLAADEAPTPDWLPPLGLGLLALAVLGWFFTRPPAPEPEASPGEAVEAPAGEHH